MESSVLSMPVNVASMTRPMTGSSTDMTMNGIMMAITRVAEMPGIRAIGTVDEHGDQKAGPVAGSSQIGEALSEVS